MFQTLHDDGTVIIPGRGKTRFKHPATFCRDVFEISPHQYQDKGRTRRAKDMAELQRSLRPHGLELVCVVGGYRDDMYTSSHRQRVLTTTGTRHPLNLLAWTHDGKLIWQIYAGRSMGSEQNFIHVGTQHKMNTRTWLQLSEQQQRDILADD